MKRSPWITWRIYFLTLPVDVIVLSLSADHFIDGNRKLLGWAFIGLLSHLSLAPLVAIGVTYAKQFRNWKFDLPYLIFLGAVRGLIISAIASILNYEMLVSTAYKSFNSALAVPEWFIGMSILVDSRRAYQKEFQNLFSKAMEKEREKSKRESLLDGSATEAEELVARLQYLSNSLATDIKSFINLPGNLRDYSQQAEKIRTIIDDDLKPASANLWRENLITVPKLPARALIKIALFDRPLPIFSMTLLSIPYLFVGLDASFDSKFALVQCLINLILNTSLFLIFELIQKFTKLNRIVINSTLIFSIFTTSLLLQSYLLPESLQLADNFGAHLVIQIFLTGSFLLLLYIAGSYRVIHRYRNQVIESLNKYLTEKKFTDIMSRNILHEDDNELAKYLHGEVQAGLAASSIMLQKAAEINDSELAQEALERAAGLLSQDHTNISYTRMASPEAKLSKIASSWKGIADIKIDFPEFSLIETVTLRNAVTLIEEAVSNSIRHANATNINISALLKEDVLTVNIIANGDIGSKGKSGLGTKLFTDLTIEWNLVNEGTHSRLTFYMFNRP